MSLCMTGQSARTEWGNAVGRLRTISWQSRARDPKSGARNSRWVVNFYLIWLTFIVSFLFESYYRGTSTRHHGIDDGRGNHKLHDLSFQFFPSPWIFLMKTKWTHVSMPLELVSGVVMVEVYWNPRHGRRCFFNPWWIWLWNSERAHWFPPRPLLKKSTAMVNYNTCAPANWWAPATSRYWGRWRERRACFFRK